MVYISIRTLFKPSSKRIRKIDLFNKFNQKKRIIELLSKYTTRFHEAATRWYLYRFVYLKSYSDRELLYVKIKASDAFTEYGHEEATCSIHARVNNRMKNPASPSGGTEFFCMNSE